MARGWESKSVEAQQADRDDHQASGTSTTPSIEDAALATRRRSLQLARARVEADLSRMLHPAHRATLEAALRGLDVELASIGAPAANAR